MKEKIAEFKAHWSENYGYIELTLSDKEIEGFINRFNTIEKACDMAQDYLLAQGDAEVDE